MADTEISKLEHQIITRVLDSTGGEGDLVIHVLLYKVILCIEVVYVLVCLYYY